jgi:hypothetical protein
MPSKELSRSPGILPQKKQQNILKSRACLRRSWKRSGGSGITDRARRAPEGNSYIERFYRSLKEEEGLDGRVSERGGSTGQHRSPDRGVPSRPASSWSRKPDSV